MEIFIIQIRQINNLMWELPYISVFVSEMYRGPRSPPPYLQMNSKIGEFTFTE